MKGATWHLCTILHCHAQGFTVTLIKVFRVTGGDFLLQWSHGPVRPDAKPLLLLLLEQLLDDGYACSVAFPDGGAGPELLLFNITRLASEMRISPPDLDVILRDVFESSDIVLAHPPVAPLGDCLEAITDPRRYLSVMNELSDVAHSGSPANCASILSSLPGRSPLADKICPGSRDRAMSRTFTLT
eukprot:m51a1_g5716 hypothetical protein (186) ;mRNA; f:1094960-1096028